MAMTPGTISVAADGTYSATPGSFAEAEFDALLLRVEDKLAAANLPMPTDAASKAALYIGLSEAVLQGTRILQYIKDNATAGGDPVT